MRKVAMVAVLALLASGLTTAFAAAPAGASTSALRIINGIPAGGGLGGGSDGTDVYLDGTILQRNLVRNNAVQPDPNVSDGQHNLVNCSTGSTGLTQSGGGPGSVCLFATGPSPDPARTFGQIPFTVPGGAVLTTVLITGNVAAPAFGTPFTDDTSPTAQGNARFQLNNGTTLGTIDVCLGAGNQNGSTAYAFSVPLFSSGEVQLPAAPLGIQFAMHPNGLGPTGPTTCVGSAYIPLAAGETFVRTEPNSDFFRTAPLGPPVDSCIAACVQVLTVDQVRPPNSASIAAFCNALSALQGLSAEIKAFVSGITLGNTATYPNIPTTKKLADDINIAVNNGDLVVPATAKPQYEVVTAGLRKLAIGLAAAGFDLTKFGDPNINALLAFAAGTGPPNPAVDAATTVLTNFFTTNCGGGAAAPATAARFTG